MVFECNHSVRIVYGLQEPFLSCLQKRHQKRGLLSEKGTIATKQKLLQYCRMVRVAKVLKLSYGWPKLSFLLLLLQTPNVCHVIPRIERRQIAGDPYYEGVVQSHGKKACGRLFNALSPKFIGHVWWNGSRENPKSAFFGVIGSNYSSLWMENVRDVLVTQWG